MRHWLKFNSDVFFLSSSTNSFSSRRIFHFSSLLANSFSKKCFFSNDSTKSSINNSDESQDSISIDRTNLFQPIEHIHRPTETKPEETDLIKHIKSLIRFRGGPITVSEYMKEVLTNPNGGFYMKKNVFGSEGHFVTSPDISQMFGEMIGVWTVLLWEKIGSPSSFNLVELGPGKGTLMADLLNGTKNFSKFSSAVKVHLVEISPNLRNEQRKKLKCVLNNENDKTEISSISGASVHFYSDLSQVPDDGPCIIIAHEFFDALPVHQFQKTERGWCEKLIDIAEDESGHHFRFVLSPQPTISSLLLLNERLKLVNEKTLKELNDLKKEVEICPSSFTFVSQIMARIQKHDGGALIIDYGDDKIYSNSIQAIKNHKFVDLLDSPGEADVSAYVDFSAIRNYVEMANGNVKAYGPITQSELLSKLGINFRLQHLLQKAENEKQVENLQLAYWRLVGDGEAPFADAEDGEEEKEEEERRQEEKEEKLLVMDEKDKDGEGNGKEGLKEGSFSSVHGMGFRYKAMVIARKDGDPPACFE